MDPLTLPSSFSSPEYSTQVALAGVDTIDLHVRSYRTALKSTLEVTINSLTNSQLKMEPILHPLANSPNFDVSAFVYSVYRLPSITDKVVKIVVGQNPDVFSGAKIEFTTAWKKVTAPARRRGSLYHSHKKLLAMFAASISDIDDLTNILIAYQTEWNKLHDILHQHFKSCDQCHQNITQIPQILKINEADWVSILAALGPKWKLRLRRIYRRRLNLRLQLLAGSWIDYTRTTQRWWKNIATKFSLSEPSAKTAHISRQEIYFVSSNLHSLVNIYTGFALKHQSTLLHLIKKDHPDLYLLWQKIQNRESFLDSNNFLYFVSKYYRQHPELSTDFQKIQNDLGIITIPSNNYLDVNVQFFPLKNLLKSKYLDPRLKITREQKLQNSDALIMNIDYPLGFTSYHILSETMENVQKVKGIYILGKAAVLNGEIGDMQVPRLTFDEHTQNTYMYKNCFNTFFPFTNNQGSILTNQKSATVLGTFLENESLIQAYSKNNLTVIEMELGAYLNALTEATYDQQTPRNTIVDLNPCPIDLGIINYTSDTPYSKAKNLGSTRLTIDGVEPVYISTLAILQRIINQEENR